MNDLGSEIPVVFNNCISVKAAAFHSGCNVQYLRRFLRNGRLSGMNLGHRAVATKLMMHAYTLTERRRPNGQTAHEYVHYQMDRLGIPLQSFRMNGRTVVLPSADS